MKKIISLLLMAAMILTMATGCGNGDESADTVSQVINVATLNGPTGMGMVKLMDMKDKYQITAYQSPTDITAKLVSGEVDVAALPSNLASVLYNKTGGKIIAISPIALGVLYIVGNDAQITDISELKGKTVIASGKGGTPEYVLQKILECWGLKLYEDVNVQWLSNHTEVNTKMLAEKGTIAMIPEPFVSTALAAGKENVKMLFDLNELWKEATGQELPMGVLVAQKSFADERYKDLTVFLNDYKESVNFVNEDSEKAAELIAENGFIPKAEIAKKAIPNCHIVLYTGKETELGIKMLQIFNETLYKIEPSAVGGKLPDDQLYFKAE